MRCARNECDNTEQGLRRLQHYAHAHVFMLCIVLILWILVFALSLVSDVSPFSRKVSFVNCISPRIRNTKYKVLSFWMLLSPLCPVIVNSICIPNSCIFHIAKKGLLRCCLYTPSVTVDRRQLQTICL